MLSIFLSNLCHTNQPLFNPDFCSEFPVLLAVFVIAALYLVDIFDLYLVIPISFFSFYVTCQVLHPIP